jgi:hypothetical protein
LTRRNGWWTKERLRELDLILWAAWDPIGAGAPPDEYEMYAPQIAQLLESGADEKAIADELKRVRYERTG